MKAPYRARDGVRIAPPPERYELLMRHRAGRDVRAVSGSFDELLDLRAQLIALGYGLVRPPTRPTSPHSFA